MSNSLSPQTNANGNAPYTRSLDPYTRIDDASAAANTPYTRSLDPYTRIVTASSAKPNLL